MFYVVARIRKYRKSSFALRTAACAVGVDKALAPVRCHQVVVFRVSIFIYFSRFLLNPIASPGNRRILQHVSRVFDQPNRVCTLFFFFFAVSVYAHYAIRDTHSLHGGAQYITLLSTPYATQINILLLKRVVRVICRRVKSCTQVAYSCDSSSAASRKSDDDHDYNIIIFSTNCVRNKNDGPYESFNFQSNRNNDKVLDTVGPTIQTIIIFFLIVYQRT